MISESLTKLAHIEASDNPFPGLRPFELHESHLFFGREGQTERLLAKLAAQRFLAVVGTSGSGKSSLVRAGLMPALLGGMMAGVGSDWRIAVMRPGNDPIGALARALNAPDVFGSDNADNAAIQTRVTEETLRRSDRGLLEAVRLALRPADENLLVLVDQFEELFRFARDGATGRGTEPAAVATASVVSQDDLASESPTGSLSIQYRPIAQYENDAAAFVKLLLTAIKPAADGGREANIYVVLTMRSDFLGDCAQFRDLPEAVTESQYLIPRLTRDQLREVIEGPVAVGGGRIAARLTNQLLNDIADNQDQLPILQHALMRTWEEWRAPRHEHQAARDEIDLCCYEQTGGMKRALSAHADEAFHELDPRHQSVAEKMFKALTERGEDNREIRRPVTLGQLCAVADAGEPEVKKVIEVFRSPGRSFLMPPVPTKLHVDTLIDISHESLIRVWQRLQAWVNEEAESAAIYRRLADAARRNAEAWRGKDLQEAESWLAKQAPTEEWAVRYDAIYGTALEFLRASQAQRAAEHERTEQQQREEAERTKRELAQAQALAEAQKQRADDQAKATARLRRLVAALVLIALLAGAAAVLAGVLYRRANEETRRANLLKDRAQIAENEAITQRAYAITGEEDAKRSAKEAKEAAAEAEKQKAFAEAQTLAAKMAKKQADEQRLLAVNEKQRAEAGEKLNRQFYYVASLNLAVNAFDSGNRPRGYELLNQFLPSATTSSADDLRDFYWRYLWRQKHQELATLKGHADDVNAVAFAPDGKTLASGSYDQTIKLWDARTGQLLETLKGHESGVHAVAFAPDGKTLASGDGAQVIKIWNVRTGQPPITLQEHKSTVTSVAFTPDSETLASGGNDGTIRLWNARTGQLLNTLSEFTGEVRSVAFAPDGKTLFSGNQDRTIRVWNARTGKLLNTLKGHAGTVHSVAIAPDGKTLASGSGDKTIKLWDAHTGQLLNTLKGHGNDVSSLAFARDGKTLASASYDQTIKLWDIPTGQLLHTFQGHEAWVMSVAFASDGKTLASASYDQTIKLWDARTGELPSTLKGHEGSISLVAFAPDGKSLVSGSYDQTINLWDARTGKLLNTLKGQREVMAFAPDGLRFASGSSDGAINLCDARTGKLLAMLKGHEAQVYSVAFAPDGKTIASGSRDGTIKLWDTRTCQLLHTLKNPDYWGSLVAFAPDGRTLASGGSDRTISLWDVRTGQLLATLKGHKEEIVSIAFAPNGQTLASGSRDQTIRFWDIRTERLLRTLQGHAGGVTAVAFTPDSKTLASGSNDETIKLWDVRTGQSLATLKGHEGTVNAVAFAPDGKTLASGSYDKTIRLWRGATDEEVARQRNQ